MKVIALSGSPNLKGNTAIALEILGEKLKSYIENLEYEIIYLRKLDLRSCNGCYGCMGKGKCVQDDDINDLLSKLLKADGIVLGSPTYLSNVTSRMQMFIERIGLISKLNGFMKGKIGASIAIARRMGANVVWSAMNYFFGILDMPVAPGGGYWNVLVGLKPGDIKNDSEGMTILDGLGKNMANLLVKLHGT